MKTIALTLTILFGMNVHAQPGAEKGNGSPTDSLTVSTSRALFESHRLAFRNAEKIWVEKQSQIEKASALSKINRNDANIEYCFTAFKENSVNQLYITELVSKNLLAADEAASHLKIQELSLRNIELTCTYLLGQKTMQKVKDAAL